MADDARRHHGVTPQFWSGKRVLVTGATGFLGGWMVARLLEYGARVVVIVRRERPESRFAIERLAQRCHVVAGDAAAPATIDAACDAFDGLDAAFHLAADSDVEHAFKFPAEAYHSAIDSTLNLVEMVRRRATGCALVVSSSDKAYGPQAVPYREIQNLAPHHPYEVAKASQDLIAQSHGKVYKLPIAVTRCANYFGGWDFSWHRIIPGTVRSILAGGPVVLRSDGKFTRDFLYIEDAVNAQLVLAERLARDPAIHGEAFNFSYEVDLQVLEIVDRLCRLLDYRGHTEINATASAEIRFMQVNSDKARKLLAWQPAFDFEAALAETVEWYRVFLAR